MSAASKHSTHSLLRENILEHLLIGELLRAFWQHDQLDVEILRSEFDAYGYDLVLSWGGLVRHIQLKSAKNRFSYFAISKQLFKKPSACIVVMVVNDKLTNPKYYWYGAPPGDALPMFPSPVGKKPLSLQEARPHYPVLEQRHFELLKDGIPELCDRLIGKR